MAMPATMIRSTAPTVSALAHVNALNGPDLGLSIQLVATATTIMATHIPAIGLLRKKFFIDGNSHSRRLKHVPAKWNPVRRQGHAPKLESTAFPAHVGSPSDPT